MWKKLEKTNQRYIELEKKIQDPKVIQDKDNYSSLAHEFSKIRPIIELYRKYLELKKSLESYEEMKEEDQEMSLLIQEEKQVTKNKMNQIEEQLKAHLLSEHQNPMDEKNVILEIRAGAGGDEAGLFCKELFIAYEKFASLQLWKVETLSCSLLPTGGFREVISKISGNKVYSQMKYEKGVHRVQRVPETESQGRVHTSTVTVAVLPEVEEKELQVKQEDLRIDVCRSSGAGGQHVNTTDSAVRITHLPTKTVVYCQDEKSQHANKDKAFKILYARLYALEEEKRKKEGSEMRLSQIGSGDRSEKVRTYNFPQSRVTDHRISFTSHALDKIMKGEFNILIQPLIEATKEKSIQSKK